MLPSSVRIGNVTYGVVRDEPNQGHIGETEWTSGRIVVSPMLQGEMAVGVFMHEVAHVLAYTAGQHRNDLRGEEYVTSVGHVLHEFARANPEVIQYLTNPAGFPMPATVKMSPYTVDVAVVTQDELEQGELSLLIAEECTIKLRGGLQPEVAAWEIAHGAVSFGIYRLRATDTHDKYVDMVFPVTGLFLDTLRRNPELTALLLEPIQRSNALELVVNNDSGPTLG